MNKQPLKLAFVDFWDGFHLTETFLNFFRVHYDVSIDEKAPDVVVYSCFGTRHQSYPHALHIFFTGENVKPDFNTCDYSFGTIKIDYRNKNLWLPISELMLPQYLPEIPPSLLSRLRESSVHLFIRKILSAKAQSFAENSVSCL